MSVSIQVAIRCRPFTVSGKLGVKLRQVSDEEGEIELLNSDYTNTRFPFTYAWWSAYGYQRYLIGDNRKEADEMELVSQENIYNGCGLKIKDDFMTGNAVVLFAYGLSGSGKTYTVFGPDAPESPDAWFKHALPHSQWGIFPRLAYDIFQEKKDGWKVTMKYFQNVVDIVRDLMSPNGEEQHYKNGMRKDPDGFMDIEWCSSKVIHSWNELREQFRIANQRKAISSTQFNPTSTRGHCIMVLELEMPHPEIEGMKQRGRLYVCDLAGTEPAGDIVCAQYKKVTYDNGDIEYKFIGEHNDAKKTKELQDQGKKINLSLSEMAQFFMKMAEAFMKKKLQPGMTIPGCNSFFLSKYLKDTMLQARTYLFCAIRPEEEFLRYTFSTLGFAKNASVVKLAPKKATVSASAAERKLLAELEAMKALVAQLQAQAASSSPMNARPLADRTIEDLQAKLAAKQNDLAHEIEGSDEENAEAAAQRAEYAKRGISLYQYEHQTNTQPYFLNIDEDAFRSNRYMYILKPGVTVFGMKGDIQPTSLSVVKDHCKVRYDAVDNSITLIGGKGETWHNGKLVKAGTECLVTPHDRVAFGDQLTLLRWPNNEPSDGLQMSAEDAVIEYQEGIANYRLQAHDSANAKDNHLDELNEERKKLKEERDKWEKEKKTIQNQRNEEEYQRAMLAIDNQILDLLPKVKEAKNTVDLLNRVTMTFDVILEKGQIEAIFDEEASSTNQEPKIEREQSSTSLGIPKVKIIVENSSPKYTILIDPANFLSKLSLLKDEVMKLRNAIENGREYTIPERHDPLYLMFDNDFLLGTSIHWPEYLLYNLETDEEEKMQDIKNAAVPYNTIGLLEVLWTPLAGPNEEDIGKLVLDIESEEDLLGKPWTYRLEIKRATDLPLFCELAYVQYDFFGETFVTEAIQQQTYSPVFEYSKIHHIPVVTQEFLKFLKRSFEFQIHAAQHIDPPTDKIGTSNAIVNESIKTGEPKGYEVMGAVKPKSDLEIRCEYLAGELLKSQEENAQLKAKIQELELRISLGESQTGISSKISKSIGNAKLIDTIVNGDSRV